MAIKCVFNTRTQLHAIIQITPGKFSSQAKQIEFVCISHVLTERSHTTHSKHTHTKKNLRLQIETHLELYIALGYYRANSIVWCVSGKRAASARPLHTTFLRWSKQFAIALHYTWNHKMKPISSGFRSLCVCHIFNCIAHCII